ncbi:hypothetical protein B0T22DRAFT_441745 [Podospora appendiculata]|uniref:RING-type domain-containing protein n=1 Tax=Podospora appendiculata TaxID=314037 RepID=A0AAE0XDK6_9PEZI|nr:hypothetical protein B0T22DRAFT_441745 [Podospora appendiculata]
MADTTNNNNNNSSNHVERQNESLWHKVKVFLQKIPNNDPPPFVTCPVCLDGELKIVRIPAMDPNAERKNGVVLVCGHMICEGCWDNIRMGHPEGECHCDVDHLEAAKYPTTIPEGRDLSSTGCGEHVRDALLTLAEILQEELFGYPLPRERR